jgi:hypothetical protein
VHENAASRSLRTIDAPAHWSPRCTCPPAASPRRATRSSRLVTRGTRRSKGRRGEAPQSIVLVQTAEEIENARGARPDRVAFTTPTTLSIDEAADIIAPLRARFPAIVSSKRTHLLRDDQSPDRRQAVRPRVRPRPRAIGPTNSSTPTVWSSAQARADWRRTGARAKSRRPGPCGCRSHGCPQAA